MESLHSMRVRTPDGREVPFSQVAEVKTEQGYSTIQRAQRRRVIKVMADVDENTANAAELRKWLADSYLPKLSERFSSLRYTMEGEGREQQESLEGVMEGFALALFAIYAPVGGALPLLFPADHRDVGHPLRHGRGRWRDT